MTQNENVAHVGGAGEDVRSAGDTAANHTGPAAIFAEAQRRGKRDKLKAPRVPHLLLGDETPEHLTWSLARQYPIASVISSEAGLILSSHGMSKDSVMRNLSLLNTLWDGGELPIGRKSSESFTVRGTRLTISLQVQEAVLRNLIEKSGDLARGSGFLARFLLAWPESTQGTRRFSEAPEHWPHLAAFNRRIAEMVHRPPTVSALWAGSVPNRSFLHRSSSLCEPRRTSCSIPSSGLR